MERHPVDVTAESFGRRRRVTAMASEGVADSAADATARLDGGAGGHGDASSSAPITEGVAPLRRCLSIQSHGENVLLRLLASSTP